jgi:hypothetical protein
MIYKLNYDFESCYSLLINGEELWTKMPDYSPKFHAVSKAQDWVAPEASFYPSANYAADGENLPDITTWSLGLLVLGKNAYEVFQKTFSESGEFLPIFVNGAPYYLFNTLHVIAEDAIDKTNGIEVIDSGVHFGTGNVSYDESALKGRIVFKTNTDTLLYSYCTESFKKLYEEHNFTGLVFDNIDS